MNRRMLLSLIGGTGAVALLALAAGAGEEQKVALDTIPAAARAALVQLTGGAPIKGVEQETEDGVTVYEAEWMVNGVEHEAAVTADGTMLEIEESIPLEQAPAAVRAVAAKHFGSAKVSIKKKTIVVYELEGKVNGKGKELLVLPTGKVHGEAGHDDDDYGHEDGMDHDGNDHDGGGHDGHGHDGHGD